MKVVIDARLWAESGVGRYIRNLIYELQKLDSKDQYFILLLKKNYSQVELKPNFHKITADFPWYGFSEQIKLPKLLNELNPDLVHFPHFTVPILYRGFYVVTIHDLIHQHFKMKRATTHNPLIYKVKLFGYKSVMASAIKKARKILVPSEFVKKQLFQKYKIKSNRVVTTYEGVEKSLLNLAKQNQKQDFNKVSQKFKLSKPYFFYVGNAHPHKNLPKLIAAFSKISQTNSNIQLVLSGPEHQFWKQVKQEYSLKNLIFTGFVSERELVTLYNNAEAFVTASLEEGFGIPLLEAMACGCPVISSNAASLPEVGGDAALYFDPKDDSDLVKKMTHIINNQKLRQELIKKGKDRYKKFSWKNLAEQTKNIYTEVIQSR